MESYIQEKLIEFNDFFSGNDYAAAKIVCDEVISDSKKALANIDNNPESENNLRYVVGMMFKSFSKFIQLHNLTTERNWWVNNKKVEDIWYVMCDCNDLLNFCIDVIETDALTKIRERFKKFSIFFKKRFGPGLYASPVIIIDRELCSICSKDVRGCEHRQGRLYNGRICRHVAESISTMKSVDLVKVPKDPRCRLWPWNEEKKGTFKVSILNTSSIDDFLY